jgi:hypothetical protein
MNEKVEQACQRLTQILPLQSGQAACSASDRALHQQMLRSFVTRGRMLTRNEMTHSVSNPDAAIDTLRRRDLVVCSETGEPVGAYPFTMQAREHRVRVNGYTVHAMCALDALAVSPMFGMSTEIDSICRVSGAAVHIRQSGQTIDNPDEAEGVHVGIAWGAADTATSCADSLCTEMIFLRDQALAHLWLAQDADNREIFTLPEAIEFASRFFVPLMA